MDSNRLYFMDALRGLGIILVVYFHIFAYYLHETTVLNEFFLLWRMPLFFFISGFFSFSLGYDIEKFRKRTSNRLKKQLYPTLIVCVLYTVTLAFLFPENGIKETVLHTIYDPAKRGYWFTYALVQVFILFAVLLYVLDRYNASKQKKGMVFLLIIALSILMIPFSQYGKESTSKILRLFWNIMSIEKTLPLIPFFFLGSLCNLYQHQFLKITGKPLFCCIMALMVALSISCFGLSTEVFFTRFVALACVVSFFVILKDYLNPQSVVGRYLVRLGKNTLPIYLFHFFVLLLCAAFFSELCITLNDIISNPIIEILVVTILSLIIIEVVMIVDRWISQISFLHKIIYSY